MSELFYNQYFCDLVLSTNNYLWVRVEMIRVEMGPCTVYIDVTVFVCMLVTCLGCKGLSE